MQVLVVGGGEVGGGIASGLTQIGHHVYVVDKSASVLTMLQERADIQVVQGDGTSPRVLKKAGLESTDMIIAVTGNDQTNMIACLLASTLRNNPIKISRIKNSEYEYNTNILEKGGLDLDLVINQDKEATKIILDLVKYPHMTYFSSFFSQKVYCVAFCVKLALIERLNQIQEQGFKDVGWCPILVDRNGHWIDLSQKGQFFEGDVVYCMVQKERLKRLYSDLFQGYHPPQRVMVLGGNELGFSVVKRLERQHFQTKLIEQDRARCFELAQRLQRCVVLHGQGSDESLLREESVGAHELFIAADEDEEVNILSCLLAKRLGTPRVIALSNKISYLPLLSRIGIDVSISPRLIAVKRVMAFIRSERVTQVEIIGDGSFELVEVEVFESDEVCGRPLSQIRLPKGVKPVALSHLDDVILDLEDVLLQPKDRIVLLMSPGSFGDLIKTFETGST